MAAAAPQTAQTVTQITQTENTFQGALQGNTGQVFIPVTANPPTQKSTAAPAVHAVSAPVAAIQTYVPMPSAPLVSPPTAPQQNPQSISPPAPEEAHNNEQVSKKKRGVPHIYHDYSAVPDTIGFIRKKTGGVTQPFPEKLHEMLNKEVGNEAVVGWLSHGRAFIVRKPKDFTSIVMPKYFRQTKLTSFQRQLNLYGFRRLTQGPDSGAYYHELFLRGRPQLSMRMVRTKVKGTGHKQPADAQTEPNFYNMPAQPWPQQQRTTSPGMQGLTGAANLLTGIAAGIPASNLSTTTWPQATAATHLGQPAVTHQQTVYQATQPAAPQHQATWTYAPVAAGQQIYTTAPVAVAQQVVTAAPGQHVLAQPPAVQGVVAHPSAPTVMQVAARPQYVTAPATQYVTYQVTAPPAVSGQPMPSVVTAQPPIPQVATPGPVPTSIPPASTSIPTTPSPSSSAFVQQPSAASVPVPQQQSSSASQNSGAGVSQPVVLVAPPTHSRPYTTAAPAPAFHHTQTSVNGCSPAEVPAEKQQTSTRMTATTNTAGNPSLGTASWRQQNGAGDAGATKAWTDPAARQHDSSLIA